MNITQSPVNAWTATHSAPSISQDKKQLESIAQELWDISQKRKELVAQEAKIKKSLIALAHNNTLVMDKFAFIKEMRKGSVLYSAIPELQAIDLEQYRKEDVEVWKLIKTS